MVGQRVFRACFEGFICERGVPYDPAKMSRVCFEEEPVTVKCVPSARLLSESRSPSVRPTTPVPSDGWPVEEPVVEIVEEILQDEDSERALFAVREVNASRGRDPRAD